MILILARTGMRPGEAYGLRWSDVSVEKREALIARNVSNSPPGPTKTGRTRSVDLSQEVISALRDLRVARERQTLERGWPEIPATIFINARGAVLDSAVVNRQFSATMKRAEISGHVLYDLRHTFASTHLAKGHPLTYVAAQLGHAKPTMTLKFYSHWLLRADRSYADALDAAAGDQEQKSALEPAGVASKVVSIR